ncbi:hypothetical protein [Cytobacillus purgationiresistens]|uniref:Uncharacterized protein n=1 Tax=Cytobacillus purgationiresistens TaxID=863449 RepID=A0ABU0APM9_9BACI|nr:hypothetical protein [Cytobacillus purgationiresistens]MDQ0272985.1 hypothetical protein [Cytobacillus purgationiresistens]
MIAFLSIYAHDKASILTHTLAAVGKHSLTERDVIAFLMDYIVLNPIQAKVQD